ncbi:MAG: hypothetical protein Terrestrivirus1_252 [Terrestrivirus sp.]|uniref:Uncharacterized protein n=1 Tax=Terrestrivirus sp. TaxID=2487775 RepID=A0A3G4ZKL3_9VIRU|nr:MAG: hypothetical protein Terrestrivirus1_252 [Terrestrivirus sp.]
MEQIEKYITELEKDFLNTDINSKFVLRIFPPNGFNFQEEFSKLAHSEEYFGKPHLNLILFATLMTKYPFLSSGRHLENIRSLTNGIIGLDYTDEFLNEINADYFNNMMQCPHLIPYVKLISPQIEFFKNLDERLTLCFVKIMKYYPETGEFFKSMYSSKVLSEEYKKILSEEVKKDRTITHSLKVLWPNEKF